MKKIYIAGKVTNEPIAECTMKFGKAQKELEKCGFDATNPLVVVGDFKTPWDIAMRSCIARLMYCDAVLLLPCFINSKGAQMEKEIAERVNIKVFHNLEDLKQWSNSPQPTPSK